MNTTPLGFHLDGLNQPAQGTSQAIRRHMLFKYCSKETILRSTCANMFTTVNPPLLLLSLHLFQQKTCRVVRYVPTRSPFGMIISASFSVVYNQNSSWVAMRRMRAHVCIQSSWSVATQPCVPGFFVLCERPGARSSISLILPCDFVPNKKNIDGSNLSPK
ncbi:uncharacterized protein LY79DRAFT_72781 [Colletotrichum navitas]|uniref:Uncharacterized protein n=1 Tax=Colletotrichum navitas TaxID=681940 RepID=A0AAD8V872_9PEZI|nr:uncharacterized protein LY79DRAFT_72781 [Colletotrichum navitas]KAK1595968.1 hypothetical protein LY79DRAFT_72781 [Colletotrichum navitas]